MAGRQPRLPISLRDSCEGKPRPATIHSATAVRKLSRTGAIGSSLACPGASAKPIARPEPSTMTEALVEKPPRERPSASRWSRCAEDSPLFGRTRGFLVRPDRAAVEERHAQRDAVALLRQLQQTLPYAMVAPADEGLRRHPPRSQIARNAAPFRAILMPPDDRLDGAAEVLVRRLVRWAALRNQRGQLSPLRIGQNTITIFICQGPNMGKDIRSKQAL